MVAQLDNGVLHNGVLPSGHQWTIKSGDHEAVVVEVGGGIRTYRAAGVDVVDGYAETEMAPAWHGQVMAPWPSRIRDGRYVFANEPHQLPLTEPATNSARHGLVNWARWRSVDVDNADGDRVALRFDLPPQPGYPWPLSLRTTWIVGPGGLRASHTVINLASTPCPFGFSVHPYLFVPGVAIDDLSIRVPARRRLLVDGRRLPIGAAPVVGGAFDYTTARRLGAAVLDTAFDDLIQDDDGGSAVVLAAGDGRGVRVWADSAFRWWHLCTSDTLPGERRRRSVAVAPMTCPPDAFRSGRDLVTLDPGQAWHGTWGLTPVVASTV